MLKYLIGLLGDIIKESLAEIYMGLSIAYYMRASVRIIIGLLFIDGNWNRVIS